LPYNIRDILSFRSGVIEVQERTAEDVITSLSQKKAETNFPVSLPQIPEELEAQ
jgi:hypothetical protein